MMDPITALGVAGNIIQFLDFGIKLTSKAHEIYKSTNGALSENNEMEVLTRGLAKVTTKLEESCWTTTGNDELEDICRRCTLAADELLGALKNMKLEGNKNKTNSAQAALKAMWKKSRVDEIKKRLVGFRDEMQFHVLVDLKCSINIESAKNSEKFDTLDQYGKAVLAILSDNNDVLLEAVTFEAKQTTTSIISKQNEALVEIVTSITKQREILVEVISQQDAKMQNAIQIESTKSDEKHQTTRRAIITKHDETHGQIQNSLDLLEASSRAEHEATRRELEQVKKAMVQIEQDMNRRDEELKVLLLALGEAQTAKERQKLQERSNAVTTAIYALVTIYQSLQKIFIALQAHAKAVITTTNIQLLFSKMRQQQESKIGHDLLKAIINKPNNFLSLRDIDHEPGRYLLKLDKELPDWSSRLRRTRVTPFVGYVAVDYRSIWQDILVTPEEKILCDRELWVVSSLVGGVDVEILDEIPENLDDISLLLESITILSSILVKFLGPAHTKKVFSDVLLENHNNFESRSPPRSTWITAHRVIVWSTIGRAAGFQDIAEELAVSRAQKWGVELTWLAREAAVMIRNFLVWFIHKPDETYFNISIGTGTDRAAGTLVYALAECLVQFGFLLKLSDIVVYQNKLLAEIERVALEDDALFQDNGKRLAKSLEAAQSKSIREKSPEMLENEILGSFQVKEALSMNSAKGRMNAAKVNAMMSAVHKLEAVPAAVPLPPQATKP